MPATVRRIEVPVEAEVQPSWTPALAGDADSPVVSPVAALQMRLQQEFVSGFPEPHVEKLPPAARLVVMVGLAGGSWALVLGACRLLFRA